MAPLDTDTRSQKTQCIEDLRRKILTVVLEPGIHLDEPGRSDIYSIPRPPLRAVLRQLAGEGSVVLHENRGAQVTPMILRNVFVAAPMVYAATTGWQQNAGTRRRSCG
jgi:DNA-binding GntR family transcriptional regulator